MSLLEQLNHDLGELHAELKSRQLESAAADVDVLRDILGQQILGVVGPYETEVIVGDKTLAELRIPEGIEEDAVNALIRTFVDQAREGLKEHVVETPVPPKNSGVNFRPPERWRQGINKFHRKKAFDAARKLAEKGERERWLTNFVERDYTEEQNLGRKMLMLNGQPVNPLDAQWPTKPKLIQTLIKRLSKKQLEAIKQNFGAPHLQVVPICPTERYIRALIDSGIQYEFTDDIRDALKEEAKATTNDQIQQWAVGIIDMQESVPSPATYRQLEINILMNHTKGIHTVHLRRYLLAQLRSFLQRSKLDPNHKTNSTFSLISPPVRPIPPIPPPTSFGYSDSRPGQSFSIGVKSMPSAADKSHPSNIGFRGEVVFDIF